MSLDSSWGTPPVEPNAHRSHSISDISSFSTVFGNYDRPQRRLSSRLEPSSRLAVKLGVVSVHVFDSKHFTRNICVLTITMSTKIPIVNVRYILVNRLCLCN